MYPIVVVAHASKMIMSVSGKIVVAHSINVTNIRVAGKVNDRSVKIRFWLWIIFLGLLVHASASLLLSVIFPLRFYCDLKGYINFCSALFSRCV